MLLVACVETPKQMIKLDDDNSFTTKLNFSERNSLNLRRGIIIAGAMPHRLFWLLDRRKTA